MITALCAPRRAGIAVNTHRLSYLSARTLATLGIRREDARRVWERRAPLTPEAVKSLTADNAVEVESCARRCFPDALYEAVSGLRSWEMKVCG